MSGFDLTQNPDGANFQAQAVLAYVRYLIGDGMHSSWDDKFKRYMADPKVTRFDNCREQGYVIFMRSRDYTKQINIAFYEHRNSDSICAVVTDKVTFNAPRLEDVIENMADEYDTAKSVGPGDAFQMAEWIVARLTEFWAGTQVQVAE